MDKQSASDSSTLTRSLFVRTALNLETPPLGALVSAKNPNAPAVKREAEEDWGGQLGISPESASGFQVKPQNLLSLFW